MSDYDILVRSRQIDGSPVALGIVDGKFHQVAAELSGRGKVEIDHPDGFILPGWIDAHVHFNEPGRTEWEGLATGSRALAAGGGVAFFDMPLNSSPPVLNREAFEAKRMLAEEKSCVDFALWAGLTPDSLDQMDALADCGAVGYKAFMCPSGLDEFQHSGAATLKAGMRKSAARGLPVAVHAELDPANAPFGRDMAAWLAWRPIQLELDAIAVALELAGETGCALQIVHVSCAEGIALISAAKKAGVNVTVETCPHYLLLTEEDAVRIGAPAKWAPPLRSRERVNALRQSLLDGEIDTIGSDHSPASPELKQGDDFFAIWGGIAGIQHGLPLLLDHGLVSARTIAANVAERFKLEGKGSLTPGCDADFMLVEKKAHCIGASDLLTRHAISPYLGLTTQHRVTATHLRGERVDASTRGRFLRPAHPKLT